MCAREIPFRLHVEFDFKASNIIQQFAIFSFALKNVFSSLQLEDFKINQKLQEQQIEKEISNRERDINCLKNFRSRCAEIVSFLSFNSSNTLNFLHNFLLKGKRILRKNGFTKTQIRFDNQRT